MGEEALYRFPNCDSHQDVGKLAICNLEDKTSAVRGDLLFLIDWKNRDPDL